MMRGYKQLSLYKTLTDSTTVGSCQRTSVVRMPKRLPLLRVGTVGKQLPVHYRHLLDRSEGQTSFPEKTTTFFFKRLHRVLKVKSFYLLIR